MHCQSLLRHSSIRPAEPDSFIWRQSRIDDSQFSEGAQWETVSTFIPCACVSAQGAGMLIAFWFEVRRMPHYSCFDIAPLSLSSPVLYIGVKHWRLQCTEACSCAVSVNLTEGNLTF